MTVDRLSATNVRAVLVAYLDRNTRDDFPWITPKGRVEIGVAFDLYTTEHGCLCGHEHVHKKSKHSPCPRCPCTRVQTTIAHVGRLDILGQLRTDPRVPCPVDHKTTYRIDAAFVNQYTMDSQLSGYLWDAGQFVGKPAHELVAFINAIELSVLPSSNRVCAGHSVLYSECGPMHAKYQVIGPIERTRRQIEEWRSTAIALALKYRRMLHHTPDTIHEVRTEGTFNGACGRCEYREWCLADRPANQVPKMFAQSQWEIWAHAGLTGPPDPLVLYVDNSILRATAACSTQSLMRYGLGWTSAEQSLPLAAGIAVHKALEVYFGGGSIPHALEAFDALYNDGGETT